MRCECVRVCVRTSRSAHGACEQKKFREGACIKKSWCPKSALLGSGLVCVSTVCALCCFCTHARESSGSGSRPCVCVLAACLVLFGKETGPPKDHTRRRGSDDRSLARARGRARACGIKFAHVRDARALGDVGLTIERASVGEATPPLCESGSCAGGWGRSWPPISTQRMRARAHK